VSKKNQPAIKSGIISKSDETKEEDKMAMKPAKKDAAIRNPGEKIERKPLTPFEMLVQALLCSNEFVYVH
jgi:hypothetical protein